MTNAQNLERLLRPRSVAVVGASAGRARSNYAVLALQQADVELHLVNPRRSELYGQRTHPNLESIGEPVDAVFVMVNASLATGVVAEAARLGAGGAVVNAAGFAELGGDGILAQQQLVAAAQGMPLLGPNCNGYIDANRGVRLSGAPPLPLQGGRIGFVTHSGSLLASMGAAGHARGIGFSHMISTGNEAGLDIVDCVNFLIDDDGTAVICLVVESLRRDEAFFSAAHRAMQLGKPIIALKLGRSDRARAIAMTHTAAVAGEAVQFEWAFRQHGIEIAHDLSELADRATCFEQLDTGRWGEVKGLAVVTASGGGAQIASDIFAEYGLELPALEAVGRALRPTLGDLAVVNPLDMTGRAVADATVATKVIDAFAQSEDIDTVLVQWFLDDGATEMGAGIADATRRAAVKHDVTLLVGSIDDGQIGAWSEPLRDEGVGILRGITTSARALQSMSRFMTTRELFHVDEPQPNPPPFPAPTADELIATPLGKMLQFEPTMDLLTHYGIKTVPFHLIADDAEEEAWRPPFPGPFAVKLANVPHRTELGAVELSVHLPELGNSVRRMRSIALDTGHDPTVVIQQGVQVEGEAMLGIEAHSEIGPIVVCGMGGTLVEVLKAVVGVRVPASRSQIRQQLLEGLGPTGAFNGWRGSRPWDVDDLAAAMFAVSNLAVATRDWLGSLDVNPFALTSHGFVALDGLCISGLS